MLHGSGAEMEFALFPSGSVRRCVRTQAVRVRSLCSELLWPTLISVICLEKLRDLSLGADDTLPTADLRFYPAALVVPCGHLPGHAAGCCGSEQYGDPERLDPAPIAVGSLRSLAAV